MSQSVVASNGARSVFCGGPRFGELSGGNWMAVDPDARALSAVTSRAHGRAVRRSDLDNYSASAG